MIPVTNVENVGLRRLSSEEQLQSLFRVLESDDYQPGQGLEEPL